MYYSSEQGAALVYTMIFTTLMVVTGLSSISFSSLEQRSSANFRTKQSAFMAAESTLLEAERCISLGGACADITTFDANCTNGLCFNGIDRTSTVSCQSGNQTPWEQPTVWSNSSRHKVATSLSAGLTGRFIIEFLCYIPKDPTTTPSKSIASDWSQLYRITALAVMDDARVMLQSTYKR